MLRLLFAILQKYDFSSKSQQTDMRATLTPRCLRYCKSTIFQANHNSSPHRQSSAAVVCDTAKVRFFKQITTLADLWKFCNTLFAILQKYDFSSKSQRVEYKGRPIGVVCDTAKVRFFKQITTEVAKREVDSLLFAILQKYDFSSKSQQIAIPFLKMVVVCDTAKVRFFKQITTKQAARVNAAKLFAILQKYDFSSKSQHVLTLLHLNNVVCDTAKVRFFKQITTFSMAYVVSVSCLRYCKSTIFQANHNCWY